MLIYILNAQGTDEYKIGITKRTTKKRISELQTGSANIITEIYKYESQYANQIERCLHRHYSHCKSSGEWYLFEQISIEEVKQKLHFFEETINLIENAKEKSPY